jgi:hypothetical protein
MLHQHIVRGHETFVTCCKRRIEIHVFENFFFKWELMFGDINSAYNIVIESVVPFLGT